MSPDRSAEQARLNDLWEEHVRDEFATRDTEATLQTMVPDAYVNHVPVMTGAWGGRRCASSTRGTSSRGCRPTRRWCRSRAPSGSTSSWTR